MSHGVEGVSDGYDGRGQRNLVCYQPVGVAGAVPTLVVRACYFSGQLKARSSGQKFLAPDRMPAQHLPLFAAELAGARQDEVRHADLADVMEDRGQA